MEVWTVANQKGGVGKTTTAINIADALVNLGQRVLLLDLDPQGSLTTYLQFDPDLIENTTYDLFSHPERIKPKATGFDGLDIVGASVGLAKLEKKTQSSPGKGRVLARWLAKKAWQYDYVVIDTPPALGMLMINAMVACDRLLIPVQTDFLALKGTQRMLEIVEMLAHSGRRIDHCLVATMYDARTNASKTTLGSLRSLYADVLWPGVIPIDTRLREASRLGIPPSFLFQESRAVKAYHNLVSDLVGQSAGKNADIEHA